MICEVWSKSDIGLKRAANEDCLQVDSDHGLVMLFDGMGGHRSGEVASKLAMETMHGFFVENVDNPTDYIEIFDDYDHSFTYRANLLLQAAMAANQAVLEKSVEVDEHVGMGSTVAAMAFHSFTVSVVNVGDSRIYLIRDRVMEQISRDHTLAEDQVERGVLTREETRNSQLKHILSSVLGVDARLRVHVDELAALPGDLILLCTDGLTAVMEDDEILEVIMSQGPGSGALTKLIDTVNARGGPDNTTLALAEIRNDL